MVPQSQADGAPFSTFGQQLSLRQMLSLVADSRLSGCFGLRAPRVILLRGLQSSYPTFHALHLAF